MPVEIEAKLKVEDLGTVRSRLRECGAAPVGRFLETNTFFDTEDRSLLAADEGLRLRINRDIESGEEQFIITYKGPRQHGQLKSRDESELEVGSAQGAVDLLRRLGFATVLTFQKRRESWTLDGCKVELDEVPHIGVFVEIEGPTEENVLRVRESLGLASRPIVKASYIALLMSYLQEHGKPERLIKFPDTTPTTEGDSEIAQAG